MHVCIYQLTTGRINYLIIFVFRNYHKLTCRKLHCTAVLMKRLDSLIELPNKTIAGRTCHENLKVLRIELHNRSDLFIHFDTDNEVNPFK